MGALFKHDQLDVPFATKPIHERTHSEHFCGQVEFEQRLQNFRDWLAEIPETEIAVVSHGTFLNRLLGIPGLHFRNAEMRRCRYCPESQQFVEPLLVCRPLAPDT